MCLHYCILDLFWSANICMICMVSHVESPCAEKGRSRMSTWYKRTVLFFLSGKGLVLPSLCSLHLPSSGTKNTARGKQWAVTSMHWAWVGKVEPIRTEDALFRVQSPELLRTDRCVILGIWWAKCKSVYNWIFIKNFLAITDVDFRFSWLKKYSQCLNVFIPLETD